MWNPFKRKNHTESNIRIVGWCQHCKTPIFGLKGEGNDVSVDGYLFNSPYYDTRDEKLWYCSDTCAIHDLVFNDNYLLPIPTGAPFRYNGFYLEPAFNSEYKQWKRSQELLNELQWVKKVIERKDEEIWFLDIRDDDYKLVKRFEFNNTDELLKAVKNIEKRLSTDEYCIESYSLSEMLEDIKESYKTVNL